MITDMLNQEDSLFEQHMPKWKKKLSTLQLLLTTRILKKTKSLLISTKRQRY